MFRLIGLFIVLAAAAGLPAQADHDRDRGAWGSLLPPELQRHDPADMPLRAPPVVVAPMFGHGHDNRVLPNVCLDAVETPDGWRRFYDSNCLLVRSDAIPDLPRSCRVRLLTWGDTRHGYDAQCLFDAGFRRAG